MVQPSHAELGVVTRHPRLQNHAGFKLPVTGIQVQALQDLLDRTGADFAPCRQNDHRVSEPGDLAQIVADIENRN